MNIHKKIRQYGLLNSLRRGLKFILRKIGVDYESFYLMVNYKNADELVQKMKKFNYSDVSELTLDDFKLGDPAVFTPSKLELIRTRYETNKYWAYGIVKNNVLAYSCWISTAELTYTSRLLKSTLLKSNEGCILDAYCHFDYRGKGLHSKMNLFRLHKLHKLNREKVFAIVLYENVPAYKTQLKSGFIVVKVVTFIRIFNRVFSFEKKKYG